MSKPLAQRVVLVGNADVAVDYSALVDGSEEVIRFNLCRNWGRNTGCRTTVLCTINEGVVCRDAYRKKSWVGWPPAEEAREIWFRGAHQGLLRRVWLTLRHPRTRKKFYDYGAKVLRACAMEHKPATYISRAEYERARDVLLPHSKLPRHDLYPSTGFLGLLHALHEPRWQKHEFVLAGFDWFAGSALRTAGHAFTEEELAVQSLVAAGRLRVLPCRAQPA